MADTNILLRNELQRIEFCARFKSPKSSPREKLGMYSCSDRSLLLRKPFFLFYIRNALKYISKTLFMTAARDRLEKLQSPSNLIAVIDLNLKIQDWSVYLEEEIVKRFFNIILWGTIYCRLAQADMYLFITKLFRYEKKYQPDVFLYKSGNSFSKLLSPSS